MKECFRIETEPSWLRITIRFLSGVDFAGTCSIEVEPLTYRNEVIDMARTALTENALKEALKEALTETLQEQRELLHEIFAEVLEDFALAEAIREGQKTKRSTREEVFGVLRAKG
jgi:DNA gyrase/topoisomerase IV subunit B